jgi:hypothetical protein
MKTKIIILLALVAALLTHTAAAEAASYTLTWQQDAGVVADNTRVERAPATGNTCGTFTEIAQVPVTTLTYLDTTAPPGLVCYRARNARTVTAPDGPMTELSGYSNVAAAPRVGNPKNLQTP